MNLMAWNVINDHWNKIKETRIRNISASNKAIHWECVICNLKCKQYAGSSCLHIHIFHGLIESFLWSENIHVETRQRILDRIHYRWAQFPFVCSSASGTMSEHCSQTYSHLSCLFHCSFIILVGFFSTVLLLKVEHHHYHIFLLFTISHQRKTEKNG